MPIRQSTCRQKIHWILSPLSFLSSPPSNISLPLPFLVLRTRNSVLFQTENVNINYFEAQLKTRKCKMYFDQLWNSLFQSPFSMLITLEFTRLGASMHLDLYKLFSQYITCTTSHTYTKPLHIKYTHIHTIYYWAKVVIIYTDAHSSIDSKTKFKMKKKTVLNTKNSPIMQSQTLTGMSY